MGGCKSYFKDCLQQLKSDKIDFKCTRELVFKKSYLFSQRSLIFIHHLQIMFFYVASSFIYCCSIIISLYTILCTTDDL